MVKRTAEGPLILLEAGEDFMECGKCKTSSRCGNFGPGVVWKEVVGSTAILGRVGCKDGVA